MTLEEAKNILLANPNLTYEEIQNQASQLGIDAKMIKRAWDEVNSVPKGGSKEFQYAIGLLVAGLALIEVEVQVFRHTGESALVNLLESAGFFALGVFSLYLSTMLLGVGGTVKKALGVSAVFASINLFLNLLPGMALIMGVPMIILTFYMLNQYYGIGVFKSILLISYAAYFGLLRTRGDGHIAQPFFPFVHETLSD